MMRRRLLWNLSILALSLIPTLGWSGRVSAQSAGAAAKPAPPAPAAAAGTAGTPAGGAATGADSPTKVKVEKGAGGKKIYRITDEIRIEGKIQKPEAFFFYQKSSINYDWQELKQDFIPKILDSVSRAPF
jgi:hypothetical protein